MKRWLDNKLARYVFTGGFSFIFEYAVFIGGVYGVGLSSGASQAASYVFALVINFLLLRGWAFRSGEPAKMKHHLIKYGILVAFNLPVTTLLVDALVKWGVAAFIAKIIVVGMAALWNYIVYDKLIFKERLSPEDVL